MDHGDSANEGESSVDTVIARSSLEEEDPKEEPERASTDRVAVAGESNSSLDTVASKDEKKRGRFGALKKSFRKDGGLFKIKKKSPGDRTFGRGSDASLPELALRDEDGPKGGVRKKVEKLKKEKKSNSLVRKLSLNKFKLSGSEQETRRTPEGGDRSRSQSQSSQESQSQSDSPCKLGVTLRKGAGDLEKENIEKERLVAEGHLREEGEQRSKKPTRSTRLDSLEKPVSTVTVVQRRSPSLTIRSIPNREVLTKIYETQSAEKVTQTSDSPEKTHRVVSTLPYAISKWSDGPEYGNPEIRRPKLSLKSDSESAIHPAKTPPLELRRKLSLLDEKRAVFRRRRFDTSEESSADTVIPARSQIDSKAQTFTGNIRGPARHISVQKFDTFSTFEGTFDEETGLGYLQGIEEDRAENFDQQVTGRASLRTMSNAPTIADIMDKSRSTSQESATSQNSGPTAGVGEKREHLYKILVIGELGAGKTSIIKRYVHQFFSQHYRATIGVDFALKVLNWDQHTIIRLQLWDIAGQERFGNMTRVYYKEAVGAFIVFDVTRSATLDAVVKWKQDLDSKVQLPDGSAIPCVLLANKCDQQKEGLVNSPNKMDEYCKDKNFSGWFETSAKENINIEEAARFLVNKILQNDQIIKGNGAQEQSDGERFALNQSPTNTKKSCSC
ncbi:uncharacterized protein LOC124181457 isoform X2 [Neodiprion fabricii]|uniref:uncharacterized protein LOC124181457 isoform X2 n=1 Tax=Neodiprion fabricii TaxID=2872261 RepID=UPI001ED92D05|nr:uncharacterized protein LOC124181457 isoform X2 [Neodiprion fabricii]